MKLGNEILLSKQKELLKNKRVGVLAHVASIDSKGKHIVDRLIDEAKDGGWKVTALFSPEHGLTGIAQDMETVKHGKFQISNPKFQEGLYTGLGLWGLELGAWNFF